MVVVVRLQEVGRGFVWVDDHGLVVGVRGSDCAEV